MTAPKSWQPDAPPASFVADPMGSTEKNDQKVAPRPAPVTGVIEKGKRKVNPNAPIPVKQGPVKEEVYFPGVTPEPEKNPSLTERALDFARSLSKQNLQLAAGLPLSPDVLEGLGPFATAAKGASAFRDLLPGPEHPASYMAARGYSGIDPVAGIHADRVLDNPQTAKAVQGVVDYYRRQLEEDPVAGKLMTPAQKQQAAEVNAATATFAAQTVPTMGVPLGLGGFIGSKLPASIPHLARLAVGAGYGAAEGSAQNILAAGIAEDEGRRAQAMVDAAKDPLPWLLGAAGGAAGSGAMARERPRVDLELQRPTKPGVPFHGERPTQPGPIPLTQVVPERATDPFFQAIEPFGPNAGKGEFTAEGRPVGIDAMPQQNLVAEANRLQAEFDARQAAQQRQMQEAPTRLIPGHLDFSEDMTRPITKSMRAPEVPAEPSPLVNAARWVERRIYEGALRGMERSDPAFKEKAAAKLVPMAQDQLGVSADVAQQAVEAAMRPNWSKTLGEQRTVMENPVVGGGDVPYAQKVVRAGGKNPGKVQVLDEAGKPVDVKVMKAGDEWVASAPPGMMFVKREKPLSGAKGLRREYVLKESQGMLERGEVPRQLPRGNTEIVPEPPLSGREALERAMERVPPPTRPNHVPPAYSGPTPGEGRWGLPPPKAGPVPKGFYPQNTTMVPQGYAAAAAQAVGNGAPPPPAPPPGGTGVGANGPLPPNAGQTPQARMTMSGALQMADAYRRNGSWFNKLRRGFSDPAQRIGFNFAWAVHEWRAAAEMRKAAFEKVTPNLERAFKQMSPGERAQAVAVMKQIKEGQQAVPPSAIPAPVRALYQEQFARIKDLRDELAAAGYFSPEELVKFADMDAKGLLWVTRDYEVFYRHSNYKPTPDKYLKAVNGLMDDMAKAGKNITKDEAAAHIMSVMFAFQEAHNAGPLRLKQDLDKVWSTLPIANQVLKQRQRIPEYMRELMGEIHNPSFALAMSVAEMERLAYQYRASKRIADPANKGVLWSDVPMKGMSPFKVGFEDATPWMNKRNYGELAGKYVKPEIFEVMMQVPPEAPSAFAMAMWQESINWFRTAKVTFSPTTHFKNIYGNFYYQALTGIPPYHPKWMQRQWQSAQAIGAYVKAKTLKDAAADPNAKWMLWAMEDEAVRPGMGTDIGGGNMRNIIEEVLREKHPIGAVEFASKMWRLAQRLKTGAGELYQYGDTQARLVSYIHNVEWFMAKKGMDWNNPAHVAEARHYATAIVNRYFASGANIGHGWKQAARTLPVNEFMSWFVDNLRVQKNVLTAPLEHSWTPILQAALFTGATYGIAAASQLGLTDEQKKALKASLRPSWADNQAVVAALRIPGMPSKELPDHVVSLDAFLPTAQLIEGTDWDRPSSILPNLAANVTLGVASGGLSAPVVGPAVEALTGKRYWRDKEAAPGLELDALLDDFKKRMSPTLLTQWKEANRRRDYRLLNPTEELLTRQEAFWGKLAPPTAAFSPEKIGPKTQMAHARGEQRERAAPIQKGKRAMPNLKTAEERDKVTRTIYPSR